MKTAERTVVMLMTACLLHGELRGSEPDREVTVCVSGQDPRLLPGALQFAESYASRMFSSIDVTIRWKPGLRNCPAQSIIIEMSYHAPTTLQPGALAAAQPFEGVHICVFYDRIARSHDKSLVATVLAHVFAHEITHILQGLDRHSPVGVMKPSWSQRDFAAMRSKPLEFADADVE